MRKALFLMVHTKPMLSVVPLLLSELLNNWVVSRFTDLTKRKWQNRFLHNILKSPKVESLSVLCSHWYVWFFCVLIVYCCGNACSHQKYHDSKKISNVFVANLVESCVQKFTHWMPTRLLLAEADWNSLILFKISRSHLPIVFFVP